MNDRELGLIIMIASLGFGALYATSFLIWVTEVTSLFKHPWSWWVIALPIAAIVAFTVFFVAWIGWVMFSASPSKREELLKGGEARPRGLESSPRPGAS
ncbi:MAG: hypothetical protein J7L75_02975 [Thermoproteales archaeon]|nr:hypothetical protein [Thermoproteales archaeon]